MNKIYTWGSVLKPTKLRAQQKHSIRVKYCEYCKRRIPYPNAYKSLKFCSSRCWQAHQNLKEREARLEKKNKAKLGA